MSAKYTGETCFFDPAVEIPPHHIIDQAAPTSIPLLEPIVPVSLDVFVTCFDELIEQCLARTARLVDGNGHRRGVEARNMPPKRQVLQVKRLSSLGFVGSVCTDEGVDLSVNVC
jgi:hypothetical protein